MIDWKVAGIAGAVILACIGALTALAITHEIPGSVAATAAAGAIGLFSGWLQPQPKKEEK